MSLWLRGGSAPTLNGIGLDAGALPADTRLELTVPARLVNGAAIEGFGIVSRTVRRVRLGLPGGAVGRLAQARLAANDRVLVELRLSFSQQALHLHRYPIVVSQEQDGVPAGKETIEITAVTRDEGLFFGNTHSREVHAAGCPWKAKMSARRTVPFFSLADALARGYDGCAFCLPGANRG